MKRRILFILTLFCVWELPAMGEMPAVDLQIADATFSGCSTLNFAVLNYGAADGSAGVSRCTAANALRGLDAGKFQLALIDAAAIPADFKGKVKPAFCEILIAYVHISNRVRDVSKVKLVGVWCGVRPAWSSLGGNASDIHRYGIASGRPGGETVEDLLRIRTPGMGIAWLNSTSEAVLYVSRDMAALALGRYQDEFPAESVRMLSVDGIAPDRKNLRSGKYPLMRRYVWATAPGAGEKVDKFLPYVENDEFRRMLLSEDLLPEQ